MLYLKSNYLFKTMELKFRAYYLEGEIGMTVKPFTIQDVADRGCGQDFSNAIIMQYTGFKDKNGTEIYKDDILDVGGEFLFVDWNKDEGHWDLYYPNINDDGKYEDVPYDEEVGLSNHKELEVVGNIWENDIDKDVLA